VKPKVLVFDLGGVLIENDMFTELDKLLVAETTETALKAQWLASAAVRSFELGHCSPEEFGRSIVLEFGLSASPDEFLTAFTGWPKGFYTGAETLLAELRNNFTLSCLSNSNELHWGAMPETVFDHAYSSHLLGKIKPDFDVFEFVTRDLGCERTEVVFFDDSETNIEAAGAFGWNACLTIGFDELVQAIDRLGF